MGHCNWAISMAGLVEYRLGLRNFLEDKAVGDTMVSGPVDTELELDIA